MKSGKLPARRCANVADAVTATIRRHVVKADAMAVAAPRVVAARMVRTVCVDRKKRGVAQVHLMASVVLKVAVVMSVEVLAIRTMIAVQLDAVPRLAAHKHVAQKVAAVRMVQPADEMNQTSKRSLSGLMQMAMAC